MSAVRATIDALAVYREPRVAIFLPLGFSAGLPLLLVFGTLSAWLERAEVDRGAIGLLSLVALPYAVKFLWAPLLDRAPPAFAALGRRRGWMICAQIGVCAGLLGMAFSAPGPGAVGWVALAAVVTAFSSATQDIAIDAYRIEAAPDDRQAACAAAYVFGYRVGMLIAGSWGALRLAGEFGYPTAYVVMAGAMVVGVMAALLAAPTREQHADAPATDAAWIAFGRGPILACAATLSCAALVFALNAPTVYAALAFGLGAAAVLFLAVRAGPPGLALSGRPGRAARWAHDAYAAPFAEFVLRCGVGFAVFLLAIMLAYRLSDLTLGVMANPFYIALGFSEAQIADVAKLYGFAALMVGGFAGGALVAKIGVAAGLALGALLVAATNLGFALLALGGVPSIIGLAAVITADNFSAGLAATAFVAFLSSITERAYAATQYALFSSVMLLLGKIVASTSGFVQTALGWPLFFVYCAALGLPAIALSLIYARRGAVWSLNRGEA
ncbi:MAG: MFS transporter, partial [Pseudomonadota bacterium]